MIRNGNIMETIHALIFIGLVHFAFYFFNTIFVSCMHLPYLSLLKTLGIEISLLRVKWFTTAFNRPLMRWGVNRSKFWSLWFYTGVVVTILLLPISMLLLLKTALDFWWYKAESSNEKKEQVFELMVPGVDIPYTEIKYYAFSLIVCSVVHELGHAMAAVKEDVRFFGLGIILFFVIPVAFVHINDEQLNLLSAKNRLRILCAGIWHNVVLTGLAIVIMGVISFIFSPFFINNTGVYIKSILPDSALVGPKGLSPGDVVFKINDCFVKNSTNWKSCLLQATQLPSPGYCVSDRMVKELDRSFLAEDKDGIYNCCDQHNKDKGYLCFEHLEGFDIQTPRSAMHFCLPTRVIIGSSHNLCQTNDQCFMLNDLCVKPALDNITKIVQIQRYGHADVLFFGHPSEIYYTVDLTDWVPKFNILSPNFPEALILICKYIAVFSLGLAIFNVVPCFFFDGQHITSLLTDMILKDKVKKQSVRITIALVITTIFTMLLGSILLHMYLSKM